VHERAHGGQRSKPVGLPARIVRSPRTIQRGRIHLRNSACARKSAVEKIRLRAQIDDAADRDSLGAGWRSVGERRVRDTAQHEIPIGFERKIMSLLELFGILSAADAMEGNEALDTLFRHQLTDLLATRVLAAHTGSPTTSQPTLGGLSPNVLRRAVERLRSDSDADVSLAALASDAGLSRFHFCRAFKESTGLSPHAWLRQHRLEQAMNMLRDTDASVVSVAVALGYASQTAFAAAFRKLTGETPSDWRRRVR